MRIKFIILICWVSWAAANAQNYPQGFSQVLVAGNIEVPSAMAVAPDSRIFVTSQSGALLLIKPGILIPDTILQLTVSFMGERGLVGIAVDPDFTTNNYIYLYYTATTPQVHNRVSRFTLDGDKVVEGSEHIVLDLDRSTVAFNHNGGGLAFGIDGTLYVAVGDGGERDFSQNLNLYHGKILRINKDGSVPPDNPFASSTREQTKRVWAYGVRNPFTIAVQPRTGRLFVNDVGNNSWEEINDATVGGRNFGWPTTEGATTNPAFTSPVFAYQQGSTAGRGCAITGGTFYNPPSTNYPSRYYGAYFFLDLCTQWISALDLSVTPPVRMDFATGTPDNAVYLVVGPDNNLYFLSRTNRALYKIVYNNISPPFITDHPDTAAVLQRESVSFSISVVGSEPFAYQWQKDEEDITGATTSTLSIASARPTDAGRYRVIVSNSAGKDTSDVAVLNVTHVNLKPEASIVQPGSSSTYIAGTVLAYSATASDDDDGEIPAESFKWQINFHRGNSVENVSTVQGIRNGTFTIPNEGETSIEVWYRVILTVTDSEGLEDKDSIDVFPETSTITIETNPPGMQILFDGDPIAPPFQIQRVEGMLTTIDAPTPQSLNDITYEFSSWNNGGNILQVIPTPQEDVTFIANFAVIVSVKEERSSDQIKVISNPTHDHIRLLITITRDQIASITVADVLGSQALTLAATIQSGENNVDIDTAALRTGLYLLAIDIDGIRHVRKVVVIR